MFGCLSLSTSLPATFIEHLVHSGSGPRTLRYSAPALKGAHGPVNRYISD